MAINNPKDHSISTATFSFLEGEKIEDIVRALELNIEKLTRDAIKEGSVIMSHTVTLFENIGSVIVTLHKVKAA